MAGVRVVLAAAGLLAMVVVGTLLSRSVPDEPPAQDLVTATVHQPAPVSAPAPARADKEMVARAF